MAQKNPRTIFIASLLVVAAAVATLALLSFFKKRPSTDATAMQNEVAALRGGHGSPERSRRLQTVMQNELAALRGEVERLKSANGGLPGADQAGPQNSIAGATAGAGMGGAGNDQPGGAPAQEGPTAEQISEFIESKFQAEAADPSWSRSAEQLASNAVSQHLPPRSSIHSTLCRTTLCEIKTSHLNMETYSKFVEDAFLSRVDGLEDGLWNGAMATLVLGDTSSGIEAVTYFSREGEPMPVYEPQ